MQTNSNINIDTFIFVKIVQLIGLPVFTVNYIIGVLKKSVVVTIEIENIIYKKILV